MITRKELNWVNIKEHWQSIQDDFGLFMDVNSKGTLSFYEDDPKIYKDRNRNTWNYHIKPVYVITKQGRIEKYKKSKAIKTDGMIIASKTIFKLKELKTPQDYGQAFVKLYKFILNLEVNKWRQRVRKDQSVLTKAPYIVLKKISPKLAAIQKTGIFE